MGTLKNLATGETLALLPASAIGRAPGSHLVVDAPMVSAFHALIRWEGTAWVLRDLDSRNGTWLSGNRLGRGSAETLWVGAQIGLGEPGPGWALVDDEAPAARATPEQGDDVRTGRPDLLALPDDEAPELLVLWRPEGWILERAGQSTPARDGDRVEVHGRWWTLSLPDLLPATRERAAAPAVEDLRLRFQVSADEEQVTVLAEHSAGVLNLGVRAHHYLVLTLARARLKDRAAGVSASEEGWLDTDTLASRLGLTLNAFYVQASRARAQLAATGIRDAAALLERRGTGRIRLGVAELIVTRL